MPFATAAEPYELFKRVGVRDCVTLCIDDGEVGCLVRFIPSWFSGTNLRARRRSFSADR